MENGKLKIENGWEVKPLGEFCGFRNGLWKGKKPPFITAKVFRMTNFTKECEMNELEPSEILKEIEQLEKEASKLLDELKKLI